MPVTLLIVDESKVARVLAIASIAAFRPSWRCIEASDAEQAWRLMSEMRIDGVFANYDLPGQTGLAFAAELQAANPTIPVAISVSNPPEEALVGARNLGVAIIARPISSKAMNTFLASTAFWVRVRQV